MGGLLRFLTGQAEHLPPEPGPAPVLPPRFVGAGAIAAGAGRPAFPLRDRYSLVARWWPTVLVVLPILVLALAALPAAFADRMPVAVPLAATGAALVGSFVVRDRGLRAQKALLAAWGGRPSERLLQWRSGAPRTAVRRRHDLVKLVLGIELPDEAAELAHSADADAAYETATAALRERTPDRSRFPLLFQENLTYGFWRNAYACRAAGIAFCIASAAVTVGVARVGGAALNRPAQVVLLAVDALLIADWLLVVTTGAVQRAAEAYAGQLFAALEFLAAGGPDRRS